MAIDFLKRLRLVNVERVTSFDHGGLHDGWNIAEWGCAFGGEAGELLNVLKKMNRRAPFDPPLNELRHEAAKEIADCIIYLDLIAAKLDIDLTDAVSDKFNTVSEKYNFPHKL